jgi:hypothetical protein
MADRSDRERGQPNRCPRRHSLINRMGPCSRTPSGPAVSTDCINRPDRRLHPTNATASIYLLQRGSHPQRTSTDVVLADFRCENLVRNGVPRKSTHRLGTGEVDSMSSRHWTRRGNGKLAYARCLLGWRCRLPLCASLVRHDADAPLTGAVPRCEMVNAQT